MTPFDNHVSPKPRSVRTFSQFLGRLKRVFVAAHQKARRLLAGQRANDLLVWARNYLPDHFQHSPSNMHRWLAKQLDAAHAKRGTKLNVLAPRGSAKSTIATLAFPLRAAVECREPYIWIVSDTKHQACAHLENIKAELLENQRLAKDFPDATGRGPAWRGNSIVLPNGVTIEAFGTGQRIRGRRRRQHRPTLILCDDLQNDGHIVSALQRERSRNWFHGMLMKAGTARTNVVNLATALHRDALAMELHRTPGWTSRLFRAIVRWPRNMSLWQHWESIYADIANTPHSPNPQIPKSPNPSSLISHPSSLAVAQSPNPEIPKSQNPLLVARRFYDQRRSEMDSGAILLWPEVEDLYTLMCMRVESGRTAFEREKQNSPINPEQCEWPESYFDETIWFETWPTNLVVKTLALDPSKGSDSRRGDYSALVALGVDRQGMLYVEADLARRPTPQIVADGVEWFRRFQPDVFGVEANQFQDLLAGEFESEFRRQSLLGPRPIAIENHTSKQVRIRRLGPYLSSHRLRFKTTPGTKLLVEQLREFPIADHDDGPDALEMSLRLATDIINGRSFNDGLGKRLPVG
jgi:predicted phage terminase large subunit-like protein